MKQSRYTVDLVGSTVVVNLPADTIAHALSIARNAGHQADRAIVCRRNGSLAAFFIRDTYGSGRLWFRASDAV